MIRIRFRNGPEAEKSLLSEIILLLILSPMGAPFKNTPDRDIKLTVVGKVVAGDLNGDGVNDYAGAFFQESKNGKFYYLMAGIVDPQNLTISETNELFLGKDINFNNLSVRNGVIEAVIAGKLCRFSVNNKILQGE